MTRRRVFYEALIVAAISLVAGFLRFHQLDAFPPGLHGDEAWTGLDAMRIVQEGYIGPYVGSAMGQPSGPLYWTALMFQTLGISVVTLRLSMAVLGALTVPVSYLLYRTMFNWRVAAVGASLLAFSYWHLAFSRTAFMLISLPLMEVSSLLFLFLALKRGHLAYFAAAGLLLGASIYTYNSAPLFGLAVILFLAFVLLKRGGVYKLSVRQISILVLSAFAAALPLLTFMVQYPGIYFAHHGAVFFFQGGEFLKLKDTFDKLQFILGRLVRAVSNLFVSGGGDSVDGLGLAALLDPLTGFVLVVGFLVSLWRWKDGRYFLIIAGILTGLLGVALSPKGFGEYRRGISMLPFIVLAAALGLDAARGLVSQRLGVKAGYWLLVLSLGFVSLFNINYYFRDWTQRESVKWTYARDLIQVGNYVRGLENKNVYVYFFSDRWFFNYETLKFLAPGVRGEDRSARAAKTGIEKDPAQPQVVYILMPPYNNLVDQIRGKYPGGDHTERKENGRLIFAAYYLK